MVTDDQRATREEVERRDDLRADQRMIAHHRPLLRVERAGLSEHGLGNADLAEVVEQARLADHVDLTRRQPERRRHAATPRADPFGVAPRVCVLGLQRVGQTEQRLIDGALDLLIEAPHVLGVAQGLLVRGVEPAIGHGEVVAGSGVHSRCHRAACGTTLSTSESKRTMPSPICDIGTRLPISISP